MRSEAGEIRRFRRDVPQLDLTVFQYSCHPEVRDVDVLRLSGGSRVLEPLDHALTIGEHFDLALRRPQLAHDLELPYALSHNVVQCHQFRYHR